MLKRKNKTMRAFLSAILTVTMLVGILPSEIAADDGLDEQINDYDIMETSTTNATGNYGAAGIEDGAVYAMQNIGTGLWASTRGSTDVTGVSNVFQYSSWWGNYQTFTFEKTDTADNTYIIYTAETNTSGGKYALYCEYSSSAATTINVYPKVYNSSSSMSGYEWQVVQQDGYIHSIHLNADPNYKLYVRGTTAGSESNTATSAVGNIIVRKSTSTTIAEQQKWRLVYVLPEGEYFIKNRGSTLFLHGSDDVVTRDFSGNNVQKWYLDHIQNGKYNLYRYDQSMLVYLANSTDGGDVYLSSNNAQPSTMWYFERLAGGTFKIESVWTDSLNYDYALQPQSSTASSVRNKAYMADENRIDEWYVMSTAGKFGFQTIYEGSISDSFEFASHGNTYNEPLNNQLIFYWQNNMLEPGLSEIDTISKYQISNCAKNNFLNTDFGTGFYVQEDTEFSENGENVTLASNQYRIAMKVGVKIVDHPWGSSGEKALCYNLLFMCQLYDGTWAYVNNNVVHILPYGELPSDVAVDGYRVFSYDYLNDGCIIDYILNYYDLTSAYFIVTVS